MSQPAVRFSVGESIGFAWRMTWRNFWRILLVGIIFAVIGAITSAIAGIGNVDFTSDTGMAENINVGTTLLGSLLQFLVTLFLALGMIRIALDVTRGEDVHVKRLFGFGGYGRYLLSAIVISIIVTIGFLIPFLPMLALSAATDSPFWVVIGGIVGVLLAIVLSLGLSLYGYFIIDKDAPNVSGLKESWGIVKPHFWPFLGLHVLLALINIGLIIAAILIGALLLLVGLLVTIPLAMVLIFGLSALSFAYAYKTMSGQEVAGSA
jgi:hypothetical protein